MTNTYRELSVKTLGEYNNSQLTAVSLLSGKEYRNLRRKNKRHGQITR